MFLHNRYTVRYAENNVPYKKCVKYFQFCDFGDNLPYFLDSMPRRLFFSRCFEVRRLFEGGVY